MSDATDGDVASVAGAGAVPPVVAVRGEVVREVDPELASFSVTVRARDSDRAATLTRLSQRQDAVRAQLDGYAGAVERRETSGVSVYPEGRRSGERVKAYTGSVTTTVTVADLSVLGDLMLRLADGDQVTVAGPWWSLRPDSPVYAQARRDAVAEAVARAREYAAALGTRVIRLVELADAGLSTAGVNAPGGFAPAYVRSSAVAGGAPPSLDLDPQRQTVRATVEARFTIGEPDLTTG